MAVDHHSPTVRKSARALLIDDQGNLILFRRIKDGISPYLVTPGGGIDPGESVDTALVRELWEELGATAHIGHIVYTHYESDKKPRGTAQYFVVARLETMEVSKRTGIEFDDETRGTYEVVRMGLKETKWTAANLKPEGLMKFLDDFGEFLLEEANRIPAIKSS
ncbi:NUDIX hydrolase [Cladochytrium replicatum]|nr:NUDIX hydrolase [Cladochytrium replicatum]